MYNMEMEKEVIEKGILSWCSSLYLLTNSQKRRNPVRIWNCPATVRGFESLKMPLFRVISGWEGKVSRFAPLRNSTGLKPQVRTLCLREKSALARARRVKCERFQFF